jgi:hypothetical protein
MEKVTNKVTFLFMREDQSSTTVPSSKLSEIEVESFSGCTHTVYALYVYGQMEISG